MAKLSRRHHYLQVALNSTLEEAQAIISQLPVDERIIVEAGTPLIKRYGISAIHSIRQWADSRGGYGAILPAKKPNTTQFGLLGMLIEGLRQASNAQKKTGMKAPAPPSFHTYIVADLKAMDRGTTEVGLAASAGADAVVALGSAPTETLDAFIRQCEQANLDSMVDMMNVEFPIEVLRKLKKLPQVVILHRGVDETEFNREKAIPFWQIQRIKGTYNTLVAVAGGDTITEVRRAAFNNADIVVVWKAFYQSSADTSKLAQDFLKEVK